MKFSSSLTEMKKWIILVLIGVFTFWGLNNLEVIGNALSIVYKVFLPFILGGALAFILNIPMVKIEVWLKKIIKKKKSDDVSSGIRIISIILSLLFFILIIGFVAFLLIPELIENIELLMKNIPVLIDKAEVLALDLMDKYPDVQVEIKKMFSQSGNVSGVISSILNYFVNGAIGFISNIVSGFISIFTAIIFSIYMLSQKEYLLDSGKKLIYAYTNKKRADKVMNILALTNKTFSKFISGQCVEAVILGCIIFVVSILAGFPYALLIATLTAITALVPIFGALIAMIVGAVLIGISNPVQAIIFIVMFLIIQQIEGNVIYPRVVGKSVGLSPLLTLLAVTVGGNLFGIVGMLIGLPLASVIYTLVKENVKFKLNEKKIEV